MFKSLWSFPFFLLLAIILAACSNVAEKRLSPTHAWWT